VGAPFKLRLGGDFVAQPNDLVIPRASLARGTCFCALCGLRFVCRVLPELNDCAFTQLRHPDRSERTLRLFVPPNRRFRRDVACYVSPANYRFKKRARCRILGALPNVTAPRSERSQQFQNRSWVPRPSSAWAGILSHDQPSLSFRGRPCPWNLLFFASFAFFLCALCGLRLC